MSLVSFSKQLARFLYKIAGVAIIAMMMLTCIDVTLRLCVTIYREYQWGFLSQLQPVAGIYELVCFFGAIAASFAMAHTCVQKGHVSVNLVTRLLPPRIQDMIKMITGGFSFVFFMLISWQSIVYATHIRGSGEVSPTLQLPFYPFIYGIGFASAAVCLVLLIDLIAYFKILRQG